MRNRLSAICLVVSPLLFIPFWLLYPAYGLLQPAAVLRTIAAAPGRTAFADIFSFTGAFLAIPATLAMMNVTRPHAPRLATTGGVLALTGWIALVGVLVPDVVAAQIGPMARVPEFAEFFDRFSTSPILVSLEILTLMHLIGMSILGFALLKTPSIPRWAGYVLIVAPPLHFIVNVSGIIVVDIATWIGMAAANATAIPLLLGYASRAEQPSLAA